MPFALLTVLLSLQSQIGERDVSLAIKAVLDSATVSISASFEPTLRQRRLYADPSRIAVAARSGLSPALFTSQAVALPQGVSEFDESLLEQCSRRDPSGRSCRDQQAAYFHIKRITQTAADEIEVLGFLAYPVTVNDSLPQGLRRTRSFDTLRAVVLRTPQGWRVVRLGILRAG